MNHSEWHRDIKSVWHPYSEINAVEAEPFPTIVRGEGVYLYDSDGNRYVDAISSWWACNLGHGHPRIVQAIKRQADSLQHSMLGGMTHAPVIELAELLTSRLPDDLTRVFLASDGSSATEAAIKIAVQYWRNTGKPQKTGFASISGGYHGDTIGAVSVGMVDRFHTAFRPLLFHAHKAGCPYCYRCPEGKESASCSVECFRSMEAIIEEKHEELAAVIVEPLNLAAGGMRIYPAEYLTRLAGLCKRRRVLLIDDEIAMGYGRSGKMWAFEHSSIVPDIVCLGKSMAAGYLPISAAVVTEDIYSSFRSTPEDDRCFYHGHTFTGNPISSAAAAETLRVFQDESILDSMQAAERTMHEGLRDLAHLDIVGDVRQVGMVGAIELVADKRSKTPLAAELQVAKRICKSARQRGALLRPIGDVIYLWPPLTMDPDQMRELTELLGELITEILSQVQSQDG